METENTYSSLRKPTEDIYTTAVQLQDRGASGGPIGAPTPNSSRRRKACLLKILLFLCGSLLTTTILLAVYYSTASIPSENHKALHMNLTCHQSCFSNLNSNLTSLQSKCSALEHVNAELSAVIEKLNKRCPITILSSQSRTCYVCPQNWMLFNSKCYLFSSNKLTWTDGLDGCKAEGAHLVIIESEEEQTFLLNEMSKQSSQKPYWIGLNDIVTEGQFFWVDNKRLDRSKSFWGVNWDGFMEPDNWRNQEDCVQIQKNATASGWYDACCSQTNNVICEKAAEGIAL
ncbi:CD209 antigen-like protein C [Polypterus senegalus]|uniref:CD209 antigen-like protein C n=1 Tax=Polypterus senegalus TaxID=55291 RepID=UPI00196425CE|nr:CD209 antigen-like protein C [Polypterus senegalus]